VTAAAVMTRLVGPDPSVIDLTTALQPIVDLDSGRVLGVEALARFGDRRPPEVHFAEAQSNGSKVDLELAAVRAGLERLAELPLGAYLTLNVSPQTATSPELHDILGTAPAKRVVLELTEHDPVADYGELERGLSALRARGMRVAIDDAGAGFASMRHVLVLRPDVIKMDVSIIRGIDSDQQRREFVRALVSFARATGCTLVAEGIETQEELAAVRALGVAAGQGFWLGRPERAAGPWQLALPPMRRWNRAGEQRVGGRFGRVARPLGLVLAAALAWPSVVAVAGLKAPAGAERVETPPAATSLPDDGGSASAKVRAPRPATALHPVTEPAQRSIAATTASGDAVAPKSGSPEGTVLETTITVVDDTLGGVVQTVGGLVGATGEALGGVTTTLGNLLGANSLGGTNPAR
jgi:EAL domain-containing protein (putative c-di-GMP-specific phosphodiesterase class I)